MVARTTTQQQSAAAHIVGPRLLLMVVVLVLLLLGLVMVYSSSTIKALSEGDTWYSYLLDQVVFALVGVACAIVIWKVIPLRFWRGALTWIVWGISLILLILVAFVGSSELGAQRWLVIGPVSFQPSEFAKIAFVLLAAHILDEYRAGEISVRSVIVQAIVFILLPVIFLYRTESDLGTTIIIFVALLAVIWVGEVPLRWIFVILAVLVVFAIIAVAFTGYRSDRLVFLDPWNDGENGYGSGWQLIHSYYAFSDGGIFGVGIGNSREKYLWLSEAETDFIFAIIGEELGLVGAFAVVVLFVLFLYAGLRIARAAANNFGAMIAGSMVIMIAFQAFLNIGCVIGLLPTTGKPLPFISSGGSSLVATLIMVGFVLAVSQEASSPDIYDRRRENLRVVRSTASTSARVNSTRTGRSAMSALDCNCFPTQIRSGRSQRNNVFKQGGSSCG